MKKQLKQEWTFFSTHIFLQEAGCGNCVAVVAPGCFYDEPCVGMKTNCPMSPIVNNEVGVYGYGVRK